jgi:nicotinate-nucleotide pyrophosphorylase (carboxylating)
MGERVAMNLVQRMCGVATQARTYADAVPAGCTTRITDTRKTTPGLRALERYAVRVGGAHNHRDDLGAAVLIKDNHVAACGGVRPAIERARAAAPHTAKIECEVDTLEQLDEALAAGADIVLLDNMSTATVLEAVKRARARGKALLEASGGITLARVAELSRAGVDAISVGALTHSVQAADVGLDFE